MARLHALGWLAHLVAFPLFKSSGDVIAPSYRRAKRLVVRVGPPWRALEVGTLMRRAGRPTATPTWTETL